VEKTVTPGSAKPLGQYMEHEKIEKIFSGDSPGSVQPCFGVKIPEGDGSSTFGVDLITIDQIHSKRQVE